MEVAITPVSEILKKGVWHYQPYSKTVRESESALKRSPYLITPLAEVVESAKRGFFRSNTALKADGVPLIKPINIRSGYIDFSSINYISLSDHEKLSQTQLQRGDVLIEIVAMSGLIHSVSYDLNEPANISQHICRLRLTEKIIPDYLVSFLMSDIGQSLLQERLTGSVSRTITIQALTQLPIICPPLDKQAQIASYTKTKKAQALQHRQNAATLQAEASQAFDQLIQGAL